MQLGTDKNLHLTETVPKGQNNDFIVKEKRLACRII
jgi:hypothetical protein